MTMTPTRWQRWRRRAFNAIAALSLLLAIAVAGLWGRSVWWARDFLSTSNAISISAKGRIELCWVTDGSEPLSPGYGTDAPLGPTAWSLVRFWIDDFEVGAQYNIEVDDWLLILVFAAPPAAWLVKHLRRRIAVGLCAKCGYDLRGSPGPACPECGAPMLAQRHGATPR